MINYLSAVLFVKDIQISKQFYTDILEMEPEMDFGKNIGFKNGLSIWEIRPDHIISNKSVSDQRINNCEFYFETDDLRGTFEKIKTKGIEFMHEIHEEPWGQMTIRFYDPDRHLIEIGETMEAFVLRFYYQKLSVEEISARTHIPVNVVEQIIQNTQIFH